jgi:hypothetical protein
MKTRLFQFVEFLIKFSNRCELKVHQHPNTTRYWPPRPAPMFFASWRSPIVPQLNRSPFLLLYGSAASYLLRSLIFWSIVSGEWPTAATSSPTSELGSPAWSNPFTLASTPSASGFFFTFFGFAYVWSEAEGVEYCSKRRRRACLLDSAS